jgi:hypothetical protein
VVGEDAGLTYDKTANALSVGGSVSVAVDGDEGVIFDDSVTHSISVFNPLEIDSLAHIYRETETVKTAASVSLIEGWQIMNTASDVAIGCYTFEGGTVVSSDCEANFSAGIYGVSYFAGAYGSGDVDALYGAYLSAEYGGDGSLGWAYGSYNIVGCYGDAGTIGDAAAVYVESAYGDAAAADNVFGVWIGEQTIGTTNYALWYDSPGVYRVKGDGVMAYYNPTFTKYTPGAANFERAVQQWTSDVLEYGAEKGGTGVKRAMRLLGAGVGYEAYTVTTLPTAPAGSVCYVTDGDAGLAWGATVVNTGAGATKYLVWYNGTNWTVMGK